MLSRQKRADDTVEVAFFFDQKFGQVIMTGAEIAFGDYGIFKLALGTVQVAGSQIKLAQEVVQNGILRIKGDRLNLGVYCMNLGA